MNRLKKFIITRLKSNQLKSSNYILGVHIYNTSIFALYTTPDTERRPPKIAYYDLQTDYEVSDIITELTAMPLPILNFTSLYSRNIYYTFDGKTTMKHYPIY